jgi:diacylglycerol kinase (ATP)
MVKADDVVVMGSASLAGGARSRTYRRFAKKLETCHLPSRHDTTGRPWYGPTMKDYTFRQRLGFALNGLFTAWRDEQSFRIQCTAAAAVLLFLVFKRPGPVWWALIILACGAVLAAELLNTALEHALDALHPDLHTGIRKAKDCAAGAVLVLAAASVCLFLALLVGG